MIESGKLVVAYPKLIIAATLAVTVAYAGVILARGVNFNGSPETLARNDSTLQFFNEIRSTFGDDRVIIVALTTDDVFAPTFISKLDRLTSRLASLDGVDSTLSLTNIKTIRRDADGVSIDRLITPRRLDAEAASPQDSALASLRDSVTRDPLYARHYVSADGRSAAINVFLKPLGEAETRAIAEEVERVVKAEAGGDEIMLAGVPIMDARGIHNMVRDMMVCSPIAVALCFVVFLATFRTFWGAALPLAALIIGLTWTIGLMSLVGQPITLATLSLPTTLMAVGSSYLFHVLNQYRLSMASLDLHSDRDARHAACRAGFNFINPAVLVSGAATMAGFGALTSSSVPTARDMGIFVTLGVLAMLTLSLAFIPAVLTLLPANALGRVRRQKDYAKWLNPTLHRVTALILHRRRAVLLVSVGLALLFSTGLCWLRVNTDYLKIFPRGSETVQAAEKLHERLAGAATIQFVITGAPGAVPDPAFLAGMDAVEQFALGEPGVDAGISVADIVKRFNAVLFRAAESIPDDRKKLREIFDDYLSQDSSISRLVSNDRARAVIVLRTNLYGSNELRALTTKIVDWSASHLPPGVSARPTGSFVLLNDASDAVAASQSSSLAIALISIYLMMVALFRSFATGLLALLPNLLPIACYFGFLGLTGTPLDITTSLIATAVLGLAVDNAVHMIRRYRQTAHEQHSHLPAHGEEHGYSPMHEGWALWHAMLRTGKPMVLANLMLMAAFLIFVLSSFVPVRLAGILWAVTIFACLVADLIFLPALMKTAPFVRLTSPDRSHPGRTPEPVYSELENVTD